jgi:hypothetical protein
MSSENKKSIIDKNYKHGSKFTVTYKASIFTSEDSLQHRPTEKPNHHLHKKVPTRTPMTLDDVLYDIEYMLGVEKPLEMIGQITCGTNKVEKFEDIEKTPGKYELTLQNSPIIITIIHDESKLDDDLKASGLL